MNAFISSLLRRKVFANTIMIVFIVGGVLSALSIKQELLPDREEPFIEISVELRGASPEEVDSSIIAVIENAISVSSTLITTNYAIVESE